MNIRHYNFSNVVNFRDLGGYQTKDGKITQFGRIFRSDEPTSFEKKRNRNH